MKWLVILILGFMSTKALGVDCNKNPIYCKILKLNPKIDPTFAKDLSNKIAAKAKAVGVDPFVSLAILMQESTLRHVNTYKTSKSVEEYCKDGSCFKKVIEVSEVSDMSIAQINIGTAKQYGFDVERLYSGDLDYALDCHYVVLKEKMKMCESLGEDSFSCYHSINDPYRSVYVKMVKRWL